MKSLLNPKWLVIITVLPMLILAFGFYNQFQIIKSLLSEESIALWVLFAKIYASLFVVSTLVISILIFLKKKTPVWYCLFTLVAFVAFLYVYTQFSTDLFPWSIPRWMVSDMFMLYVGAFLMPTIAHALFSLVVYFTPENRKRLPALDFLMVIITPLICYLFSQFVFVLWKPVNSDFFVHFTVAFFLICTIVFLFFLVRWIYTISISKNKLSPEFVIVWKVAFSLVLPIVGLFMNHSLDSTGDKFDLFIDRDGIFGNFDTWQWYLLTVVNGLIISIPPSKHVITRLIQFFVKSITFGFTFYFFLVFLPFLPLSIVAIIVFGLGFLMLSPLVLFVIHLKELNDDFEFLRHHFLKYKVVAVMVVGMGVLPISVFLNYTQDRIVLHNALDYLYTTNYDQVRSVSQSSLRNTLDEVKKNKNSGRGMFSGETPYFSTLFNWLVMDNMMLSDEKIALMENVFLDERIDETETVIQQSQNSQNNAALKSWNAESTYNAEGEYWESWLDLTMDYEATENWRLGEFRTSFSLPQGCWISDYYLEIEGKKKYGLLAEKKAALWVYTQIVNERRDPGILYYENDEKIAFRVFPFQSNETRKSGIQFIHKYPVEFSFAGNQIKMGEEQSADKVHCIKKGNVLYVPEGAKENLEAISRTPYYHFVIDVSNGNEVKKKNYEERIKVFLKNKKSTYSDSKFTFCNAFVQDVKSNWEEKLTKIECGYGFYLERALKSILVKGVGEQGDNKFPVIIVVTDEFKKAVFDTPFDSFKSLFPETDLFFELNNEGMLLHHSLMDSSLGEIGLGTIDFSSSEILKCETNGIGVNKNSGSELILLNKNEVGIDFESLTKWEQGMYLHGEYLKSKLFPGDGESSWDKILSLSIKTGLMTPLTSYIVVENEAQEAMIKKKQDQVIDGNKGLDLQEEVQEMTEPEEWLMVAFLLFLCVYYRGGIARKLKFN